MDFSLFEFTLISIMNIGQNYYFTRRYSIFIYIIANCILLCVTFTYVWSYILILFNLLSVWYNHIFYFLTSGHNATDDIMTEIKPADCTPPRCQTLVGFDAPPINMITYPHNTELPRRQPIANFAEKSCKICAAAIFIGLEHCIMNLKRSEDRGIIKNRINEVKINYLIRRNDHSSNNCTSSSTQIKILALKIAILISKIRKCIVLAFYTISTNFYTISINLYKLLSNYCLLHDYRKNGPSCIFSCSQS